MPGDDRQRLQVARSLAAGAAWPAAGAFGFNCIILGEAYLILGAYSRKLVFILFEGLILCYCMPSVAYALCNARGIL